MVSGLVKHLSAILVVAACAMSVVRSADLYHYQVTALKDPECVQDAAGAFFSQNIQQTEPLHPVLPVSNFYLLVRYLGESAIGGAPEFDFSKFPDNYADPSLRGSPLTNLRAPDPKSIWQRANRADATMDDSSAFQIHCFDAASFINTWTFPPRSIDGGGPHAIFGYSFNDPPPPAIFDNRFAANPTYPSFVAHDGGTPFVSMPLNSSAAYATLSPYSSVYTGTPWTGLRFFRAHITQENFRHALADINAYCAAHGEARYCYPAPLIWTAYSLALQNYELTDFGVIHEISRGGPTGNVSMAIHVYGLGAWNFR